MKILKTLCLSLALTGISGAFAEITTVDDLLNAIKSTTTRRELDVIYNELIRYGCSNNYFPRLENMQYPYQFKTKESFQYKLNRADENTINQLYDSLYYKAKKLGYCFIPNGDGTVTCDSIQNHSLTNKLCTFDGFVSCFNDKAEIDKAYNALNKRARFFGLCHFVGVYIYNQKVKMDFGFREHFPADDNTPRAFFYYFDKDCEYFGYDRNSQVYKICNAFNTVIRGNEEFYKKVKNELNDYMSENRIEWLYY